MDTATTQYKLVHDTDINRFSLFSSGSKAPAAFVEYATTGGQCPGPNGCSGVLDLYHTFTDPQHRGKGLAGQVVLAAFQYAAQHKHGIVPSCSYISRAFLTKHPECRGICVTGGQGKPKPSLAEYTRHKIWNTHLMSGVQCSDFTLPCVLAGFKEVAAPASAAGDSAGAAADTGAIEDDEEEEDDEARSAQHAAHMFTLSFTQYSRQLGLPAASADLAFENAVASHSGIRTLARLGSLLVSRGKELEGLPPPISPAAVQGGGDGSQRGGKSRRSNGGSGDAGASSAANSATAVAPGAMSAEQCFARGAKCLYRCWEVDTSGDWLNPSSDRALEACVARGLDVGVTHA